MTESVSVRPAKGKLGVLLPGMGAVATTFVAGVEAVRQGSAQPFGSLTQMGTIRLGKRTENRAPLIKDFVPLAEPERPRLRRLGHLRGRHVHRRDQGRRPREGPSEPAPCVPAGHPADVRGLRQALCEAPRRAQREEGGQLVREGAGADGRHPQLQGEEQLRPPGDGVVRLHRDLPAAHRGAPEPRRLRGGPEGELARDRAEHGLRVRLPQERGALRQRRSQSDRGHPGHP